MNKKLMLLTLFIPASLLIYSGVSNHQTIKEYFDISSVPNFKEVNDVTQRKEMFFNYLKPYVENENKRIIALRDKIKRSNDTVWLSELAKKYRLSNTLPMDQLKGRLLEHIDIIPVSLALAQAAIESNWGRSRFARYYHNFFGLWCFSSGCGVVPKRRDEDASHEVAVFPTPQESVSHYMLSLNRHQFYQQLRQTRLTNRKQTGFINGTALADGLSRYSAKGQQYIDEVKAIIRINNLNDQ